MSETIYRIKCYLFLFFLRQLIGDKKSDGMGAETLLAPIIHSLSILGEEFIEDCDYRETYTYLDK